LPIQSPPNEVITRIFFIPAYISISIEVLILLYKQEIKAHPIRRLLIIQCVNYPPIYVFLIKKAVEVEIFRIYILPAKGEMGIRVHQNVRKLKSKLKEMTRRSNAMSMKIYLVKLRQKPEYYRLLPTFKMKIFFILKMTSPFRKNHIYMTWVGVKNMDFIRLPI